MVTIDLLITKKRTKLKLSELGVVVTDVIDHSPSLSTDIRSVKGRNGGIFNGATHTSKTIDVEGHYTVGSITESDKLKDELNGLLADSRPFFITKMLPEDEELYAFEVPGETTGDIDLLNAPHVENHYRWKVLLSSSFKEHFRGATAGGLTFDFSVSFKTVELPYGETIPEDISISDSIIYNGTAINSQLDYPWVVELIATASQSGSFEVVIGDKKYIHTSQTPIKEGDVFEISGISTHANDTNVTHRTNYEYFELDPLDGYKIPFSTSFVGTVKIKDFKELYI